MILLAVKLSRLDDSSTQRVQGGMVGLQEACDVTNNGCHHGVHLRFSQEFEIIIRRLRKHAFFTQNSLTTCHACS